MDRMRAALLAVAAFATAGCLQGERVIHVQPDGSGRIEDSVKLTGEFAEMLAAFEDAEGEKTPEEKLAEKKEKARKAGEKMGPGVSLVSFEVAEDGTEKTVYAFEDITKLSIADSAMPPGDDEEEEGGGGPPTEAMTFRLERDGGVTTLVVVHPVEEGADAAAAGEAPSDAEKEQAVGMFRGMFEGARVRTVLRVGGEILDTDSPHRDGSTITLLEIDFDELLADQASVETMAMSQDRPSRETLSQVEGITISEAPEITVRFRE